MYENRHRHKLNHNGTLFFSPPTSFTWCVKNEQGEGKERKVAID